MKINVLLAGLAIGAMSCNSSPQAVEEVKETVAPVVQKYTLTEAPQAHVYDEAKLNGFTYDAGKFDFAVENYELGAQTPDAAARSCANSGKGQHIHLILNDHPYKAKYTNEFVDSLADGEYNMLAFLSRSYHQSIKNGNAAIAEKIVVKDYEVVSNTPIETPALFYSRPKGTYKGVDTKNVLLDFYPVNVEIGKEYKVKAVINGEEHLIDAWKAYFIEGLPMGDNTLELSLVDGNGVLVEAPFNPVARVFSLKSE